MHRKKKHVLGASYTSLSPAYGTIDYKDNALATLTATIVIPQGDMIYYFGSTDTKANMDLYIQEEEFIYNGTDHVHTLHFSNEHESYEEH